MATKVQTQFPCVVLESSRPDDRRAPSFLRRIEAGQEIEADGAEIERLARKVPFLFGGVVADTAEEAEAGAIETRSLAAARAEELEGFQGDDANPEAPDGLQQEAKKARAARRKPTARKPTAKGG